MSLFSKFSHEELNDLKLGSDDGKKIKGVIEETDQLLGNTEEPVDEANKILLRASEKRNEKDKAVKKENLESPEEHAAKAAEEAVEEAMFLRKEKGREKENRFDYGQEIKNLEPHNFNTRDYLLDNNRDIYTNVEKGSMEEMFFNVLEEKFPLLMISLNNNVKFSDGTPAKNFTAIKTIPYQTDLDLILDLSKNKVIRLMTEPWGLPDPDTEKEVEDNKILSHETILAIKARCCQQEVTRARNAVKEENLRDGTDPEWYDWKQRGDSFQEYLEKMNVKPISDVDLKIIIEKAVELEYKEIRRREDEEDER